MIRTFLIRIMAAALICGIVQRIPFKNSANAGLVKLLCGVVMLISLFMPVSDIGGLNIYRMYEAYASEGAALVQEGAQSTKQTLCEVILQQTQTYILDKAKTYGAQISVEVTLSNDDLPVPVGVRIEGNISPYGKRMIQDVLEKDLGISRENQQWN